jgi:hypothetical protein
MALAGGQTAQQAQRNAISRALARGGAAAVTRIRFGLYRVASNSREGRFHTVSVDGQGVYRCDCEAGIAARVCWAQAAVFIAKVEHASKGRVTAPAPPVQAPAPLPANVTPLRRAA